MGPLIPQNIIPLEWNNLFALLLGMAFGFVLEASGFSSSRKIMGTFYGYDFLVLRVFFTATITAMLGILYLDYLGWLDFNMLYIHPTYLNAAITGGVIMGLGFALGGFCPGTSYCAVAIGKLDALAYSVGLFLGIFLFSEFFPLFEGLYSNNYMGQILASDFLGLGNRTFMFMIVLSSIVVFWLATLIQRRVKKVEY